MSGRAVGGRGGGGGGRGGQGRAHAEGRGAGRGDLLSSLGSRALRGMPLPMRLDLKGQHGESDMSEEAERDKGKRGREAIEEVPPARDKARRGITSEGFALPFGPAASSIVCTPGSGRSWSSGSIGASSGSGTGASQPAAAPGGARSRADSRK